LFYSGEFCFFVEINLAMLYTKQISFSAVFLFFGLPALFSQGFLRTYGYSAAGYTDMGFSIVQATYGRYVISGHCVGIELKMLI